MNWIPVLTFGKEQAAPIADQWEPDFPGIRHIESEAGAIAAMFDLNMYPTRLRDGFRKGAMYWPVVVGAAKEIGYRHVNELTDPVFHMHHPELKGRSIHAGETALINEWNGFRSLINASIGYKPPSPPPPPSITKLLADADLKALGGDVLKLEARSKLRAFLVRDLGGSQT